MKKCLGRYGMVAGAFALLFLSEGRIQADVGIFSAAEDARLVTEGKLRVKPPVVFEENHGQIDDRVAFLARGSGFEIYLTRDGEVWLLDVPKQATTEARKALRIRALGGRERPDLTGMEARPGTVSYFRGNTPEKWQRNLPTFRRVKISDVYPGIDWILYASEERLEYDFVVSPGADPAQIRLAFDDPLQLGTTVASKLDPDGSLAVLLGGQEVRFARPQIFQPGANGQRDAVEGGFAVEEGRVSFVLGSYDVGRPLVIDPILLHASYLGGNEFDWAESIAFDAEGNIYISSTTISTDFPTVGALQTGASGGWDAAITKLNPSASEILFSTYIGGSSTELYTSVASSADGVVMFIGGTISSDLPMVNSWDPTLDIADIALYKLSPDGSSILFSTYYGGSGGDLAFINFGSYGYANMSVDESGRIYVAGASYSDDLPVTPNALQPTRSPGMCGSLLCPDPFLAVFSPDGQTLLYATYFGAPGDEWPMGVAAGPDGYAYLYGVRTPEAGLLPTINAFQSLPAGGTDLYVAKIPIDGSPPEFATYFGGSLDDGGRVVVGKRGEVVLFGATACQDFPLLYSISPCVLQNIDGFVAQLNVRGTALELSTLMAGAGIDDMAGVGVDAAGNLALGGRTNSADFPTVHPVFPLAGSTDAYAAYLHTTGPTLLFSTFYGGARAEVAEGAVRDLDDSIWVHGIANSEDLPVTPDAVQPVWGGSSDPYHPYDEGFYAAFQTLRAAIATPSRLPATVGQPVDVPVTLAAGGLNLAALAFVLPIPECLDFDPTDGDLDGVPDAITLMVPAAFSHRVTWNSAGRRLGVALFDATLPFARFQTGTLMTLRLTPSCQPPSGFLDVELPFANDPAPSFGLQTGLEAPGDALTGSVRIFGGLRGDCNGSGSVNAADLAACVLEVSDSDGSFWLDALNSTFAGNPFGCDANGDTVIDAGDLACKSLLVLGDSCIPARASAGSVRLLLPEAIEVVAGETFELPISLESGGERLLSTVFSLDLPATLSFDPTDGDGDGLPDSVVSHLPPGLSLSVQHEPGRRYGEVRVIVPPGAVPLPEGVLLSVGLQAAVSAAPGISTVSFGAEPRASWGSATGASVSGDASVRTLVTVLPSPTIFVDDFETGDASRWSVAVGAP